MATQTELLKEINELTDELDTYKNGQYDYSDNSDFVTQYNEMLDECAPCTEMTNYADYLEQNDPVGYRCGMCDYIDSYIRSDEYKNLAEYTDILSDLDDKLEEYKDTVMGEFE